MKFPFSLNIHFSDSLNDSESDKKFSSLQDSKSDQNPLKTRQIDFDKKLKASLLKHKEMKYSLRDAIGCRQHINLCRMFEIKTSKLTVMREAVPKCQSLCSSELKLLLLIASVSKLIRFSTEPV